MSFHFYDIISVMLLSVTVSAVTRDQRQELVAKMVHPWQVLSSLNLTETDIPESNLENLRNGGVWTEDPCDLLMDMAGDFVKCKDLLQKQKIFNCEKDQTDVLNKLMGDQLLTSDDVSALVDLFKFMATAAAEDHRFTKAMHGMVQRLQMLNLTVFQTARTDRLIKLLSGEHEGWIPAVRFTTQWRELARTFLDQRYHPQIQPLLQRLNASEGPTASFVERVAHEVISRGFCPKRDAETLLAIVESIPDDDVIQRQGEDCVAGGEAVDQHESEGGEIGGGVDDLSGQPPSHGDVPPRNRAGAQNQRVDQEIQRSPDSQAVSVARLSASVVVFVGSVLLV